MSGEQGRQDQVEREREGVRRVAEGRDVQTGQELELRGRVATPMMQWVARQAGVDMMVMDNGLVAWSIPPEMERNMVLLTPKAQIAQVDSNFTPLPAVVQIDTARDTYKVGYKDFGGKIGRDDEVALTSTALAQIAQQAAIEHVNTKRVHFPGGMETLVTVKYLKPDGVPAYTTKAKVTDFEQRRERVIVDAMEKREKLAALAQEELDAGRSKWPNPGRLSDADYKRYKDVPAELRGKPVEIPPPLDEHSVEIRKLIAHDRDFQAEKDETKAFSRCVRAIMGARSYSRKYLEQRNGRFFLVRYVFTPDYSDASMRHLIDAQFGQAAAELYGDGAVAELEAAVTETGPKDVSEFAREHSREDRDADVPDEPDEDADLEGEAEEIDGEPVDGQQTLETDPPPGFEADPAYDGADEWDEDPDEPVPPSEDYTFTNGPFKGKAVSEVIKDPKAVEVLRGKLPKLRAGKAAVAAWLEYVDEQAQAA